MKQQFFFYALGFFWLIILMFIIYLVSSPTNYALKLINYDLKIHRYVLFPQSVNFKPSSVVELVKKFETSEYNFIYYLDETYFKFENEIIFLKLKV